MGNPAFKGITVSSSLNTDDELLAYDRSTDTLKTVESQNTQVGSTLTTEAGVGITGGTGTVYRSSVHRAGGVIVTQILIDITGLNSAATDLDIIGTDGAGAAHLGQITAAQNGTILAGVMQNLEIPAGGDPNIALYSANEATGVEDTLITALTETLLYDRAGDWVANDQPRIFSAVPPANDYLYLVQGDATGTDATYTAGKFLITLYGY